MSWLARSIANSLNFDDDGGGDSAAKPETKQSENSESDDDQVSSPTTPSRGVKEDLSELSKTLTRQFWGVASFLAPPPQEDEKKDTDLADLEQDPLLRVRDDFAEIGGKFRSGISRLSNNINVSEITKLATNFLQLESDDEREGNGGVGSLGDGAVGVTEEVVAFARDVAMHPETWLDFPLPEDDADDVGCIDIGAVIFACKKDLTGCFPYLPDFELSDAQQEHALAVERLAPRLAALRIELCPGYMTENCFWKIYFVLVHPRLDKNDAVLLSTQQVLEARALLAYESKKQNTTNAANLSGMNSTKPEQNAIPHHEEPLLVPFAQDTKTVASSVDMKEIQIGDESTPEEKHVSPVKVQQPGLSSLDVSEDLKDEDDADDWLKEEEETSETGKGNAAERTIPIENEDDVSFSDLEDDDVDAPASYRKSSSKDIDMKENETKESDDWLDVDDIAVS